MNPNVKSLLMIAQREVGTKEIGNNGGPRIIVYQGDTWLAPGSWPWCAAFCCYVLRTAFSPALDGMTARQFETWRCKDASAFGWIKWARNHDIEILDEGSLAKAGDFVVFDFSHIGIVVKDQSKLNDFIHTIEGNTAISGSRDGDGVYEKRRNPNLVRAYIRIFPEES